MDKIEIINIAKEFSEVVKGSFQDDFLDSEAKLYRLGSKIDLRIEPLLLDESSDPSGFIQQILREGHVIYSQD